MDKQFSNNMIPKDSFKIPTLISDRDRTAKEVIDQAIRENRFSEWLMYAFAIIFVVAGVSVLIFGAKNGEAVATISGAVASALFYPAMASARRIRKENIAIRLLEAPLSRSDTSKAAAESIRSFVNVIMCDKELDRHVYTKTKK
jgi:hypothetical protein